MADVAELRRNLKKTNSGFSGCYHDEKHEEKPNYYTETYDER